MPCARGRRTLTGRRERHSGTQRQRIHRQQRQMEEPQYHTPEQEAQYLANIQEQEAQ